MWLVGRIQRYFMAAGGARHGPKAASIHPGIHGLALPRTWVVSKRGDHHQLPLLDWSTARPVPLGETHHGGQPNADRATRYSIPACYIAGHLTRLTQYKECECEARPCLIARPTDVWLCYRPRGRMGDCPQH